jgi:hypothetical protein
MNVATARAQILAKSTTNNDLIDAIADNEIQVDGSGNVLAPNPLGVYTILADADLINFALALP